MSLQMMELFACGADGAEIFVGARQGGACSKWQMVWYYLSAPSAVCIKWVHKECDHLFLGKKLISQG